MGLEGEVCARKACCCKYDRRILKLTVVGLKLRCCGDRGCHIVSLMGIRVLIEDAVALWHLERYESSLVLAISAAAGTSRLRYPASSGIASGDALANFLQDERLVLSGGNVQNLNVKLPGVDDPKYADGLVPWHIAIGSFFRNWLLHEGKLRSHISFGPRDGPTLAFSEAGLAMSPYLVLCLVRVVETARENRSEWPEVDTMPDTVLFEILFPGKQPQGLVLEYMQMRHGRYTEVRGRQEEPNAS